MKNVLIDTNVIISLEDTGRVLDERFAELNRLCRENSIVLKILPDQRDELLKDKNVIRREIMLSRIRQYPEIGNAPSWSQEDLRILNIEEKNGHDYIDNLLLCACYRNAVHFLVTEDRGIHKKAAKIGISERVYYVEQFLGYLRKCGESSSASPPLGIVERFLYEFDKNDVFFDSLRSGYEGFNDWFDRAARENRKVWVVGDTSDPLAIVVRKTEQDEIINNRDEALPGKILKLCTFKVSPKWRGRKIGERLLYTAFQYAIRNKIDWVYITAFGKEQKTLISLCEEYGFENRGIDRKNNRDQVYVKDMRRPDANENISNLEYAIKHYPFYRRENCRKWIVPILPRWHTILFPDLREEDLFSPLPESYLSSSNTIKKAYLCHANTKKIQAGDLVYFYRSRDRKSVECVGIVEKVMRTNDIEEIINEVSKRSVYTNDQIISIAQKETLLVLFRILEFITPYSLEELCRHGVRPPIQTIREISFAL